MTSPRPGSWIKPASTPSPSSEGVKSQADSSSTSAAPKKPFVRKPNLTDRPFKGHEGLAVLRESLRGSSTKSAKSKPSSKKRIVKKTDTKENN